MSVVPAVGASARIVHLTTVHGRRDTRILLKQCRSLGRRYPGDVALVVSDGLGDELDVGGVAIHDMGPRPAGRVRRILRSLVGPIGIVRKLRAEVIHFHDPELIPLGILLRLLGHRVVYDAHENVPEDIMSKSWVPAALRAPVAGAAGALEWLAARTLSAIVAATPAIETRFVRYGAKTACINNFPLEEELQSVTAWSDKERGVCYLGGIAALRGIRELVQAMDLVHSDVVLSLAGTFSEPDLRTELAGASGWRRVRELGHISRAEARDLLGRSLAGLVTFHGVPNHVDAQPNKMFEYMSAGLPVITSSFPLWREIVEGNDCGVCVDPLDPAAIAAAIDRFVENPAEARRQGDNGRRAVVEKYNWAAEEKKLLALYEQLLPPAPNGGRGAPPPGSQRADNR